MDTLTSSATFSSWNDYLGLATLITKAEKGFDVSDHCSGPRGYGLMLQGCSSTDWQPMMEPLVYPKSISEQRVCVFCRNNKETAMLYSTHTLKGADGRVQCPVLRRYTCPLCGASGDQAHTIKYCPLSRARDKAQSFQDNLGPQARADDSLKSNLACCSLPQPQMDPQITKPIILFGHLMGPEASGNQHPKYCPPSHSGARGRMARFAMGRIIR